jgi:spore coat polysaccharide biosynthesis protein SpsF
MFVIIIQARMGSTRLPGKVMKNILGEPIISWVYKRSKISNVDDIIISTSTNNENDVIEQYCNNNGIKIYRGSENDLLDRYYQTIQKFYHDNNDINIIRITCDCPFIDSSIINEMIMFYKNNDYNYIINHSDNGITPEGSTVEIINYESLKYLWNNIQEIEFREHATGLLTKKKYVNLLKDIKFYKYTINYNNEYDQNKYKFIKLSVDTNEDFERSIRIAEYFNTIYFKYTDIFVYFDIIFF